MSAPDPSPLDRAARDTDDWGVARRWLDDADTERTPSAGTLEALRAVIGAPPQDLERRAPIVLAPGRDAVLPAGELECEDGTRRPVGGPAPEDLPLGYHWLHPAEGPSRRVIVSPGRCHRPDALRTWGWAVQLYAARSAGSWATGDLADLRALRELAQAQGAGFLLVNPLHGVAPTAEQEDSPYLPATRRYRNPLYLRVEEVPGVELTAAERAAGAALGAADALDRDAGWALHQTVLRRAFSTSAAFERWRTEQGEPLEQWARWCSLAQTHGEDFHDWPVPLRDPVTAPTDPDEVTFHAWLQWCLAVQLEAACDGLTVLQDLPIGVSGGGADAWAWQDVLADGVTVGAPADAFNSLGQDWGSPPLVPWRLRLADYEPFVQSVRATLAGGGGLRIDHVMGLFRLWWVPAGMSPADGAYVRYPWRDMLAIVALESHRAGALVVGEDLGVVEDGVREALAEHDIFSYRVLYFEDDAPADYPVDAMAAVSTHDLPTVAGLLDGSDVAEMVGLGLGSAADLAPGRQAMLDVIGAQPGERAPRAVLDAYRKLGLAPSAMLCATLDDAVLAARRPNIPGTTARANWCIPLPVRVEDLGGVESVRAVAEVLTAATGDR
jgi:4-alpha-glucanotransferase